MSIVELHCGPTAAGKTTSIVEANRSYRYTTREKRDDEIDTRNALPRQTSHGYFVNEQEFMQVKDRLVGIHRYPDPVSGDWYGFSEREIAEAMQRNEQVSEQIVNYEPIAEIEQAFSKYGYVHKNLYLAFIDEITKRLTFRSPNDMKQRLQNLTTTINTYLDNLEGFDKITFFTNSPYSKEVSEAYGEQEFIRHQYKIHINRGWAGKEELGKRFTAASDKYDLLRVKPKGTNKVGEEIENIELDHDVITKILIAVGGFRKSYDMNRFVAQTPQIEPLQIQNTVALPTLIGALYLEQFDFIRFAEMNKNNKKFNQELFNLFEERANNHYDGIIEKLQGWEPDSNIHQHMKNSFLTYIEKDPLPNSCFVHGLVEENRHAIEKLWDNAGAIPPWYDAFLRLPDRTLEEMKANGEAHTIFYTYKEIGWDIKLNDVQKSLFEIGKKKVEDLIKEEIDAKLRSPEGYMGMIIKDGKIVNK